MRTWLMTVAVGATLVGCAHQDTSKHASRIHHYDDDDRVVAAPAPAPSSRASASASASDDNVRIVAHKPSSRQYKFVGRVSATAGSGDLVAIANSADADLKRQAAALGASIVQIDVVTPPAEHAKAGHVVMAGRAYQEIRSTNVAKR